MKNKYMIRSRISEKKFREILRYFALDLEAIKIAQLARLSRNSINKIALAIRVKISEFCELESPFKGEI